MKRLTTILIMGILATLFGCGQNKTKENSTDNIETQPITKPVENITATADQIERRTKSEDYCKSKNIPVYKNPNSLFVETDDKVTIRTKDEIVDRALALCYLERVGKLNLAKSAIRQIMISTLVERLEMPKNVWKMTKLTKPV